MGENAQVPVLDGGRWLLIPGEDGVDEQAAAARTDRANVPMGSDQAEVAAVSAHEISLAMKSAAALSGVMWTFSRNWYINTSRLCHPKTP